MSRYTIVLYLLILSAVFVEGSSAQYRFDRWTTDNGLPQNGVRQITQTPEGYLWFTTFDGLVRFDGVKFTSFNKGNTKGITNNRFTGIFADKDGTVYATTMEDGILTVYQNGRFRTYPSEEVPGHYIIRAEREETGVRFLVEDENRASKSWYRLVNDRFEFIETQGRFNENVSVNGVNGSRWIINRDGVTEIRDGKTIFTPLDLSKLTFNVNSFADREGRLWIAENKVYCIENGVMRTFAEKEGLPATSLYHSFWQEADGSIWLSSGGASSPGVGLIQIKDGKVSQWGNDQGLAGLSIQDLFNDREGSTWLATGKGLMRRRKELIRSFSVKDGLDHSEVYPIFRDSKNTVWIGSTKGLSIYRDGKFQPLELKNLPGTPIEHSWRNGRMSVQALWEDRHGTMWVGLNGGLFTVKDGVAAALDRGAHVFAIKSDRAGNIWAATNKGMVRFDGYKVAQRYSVADGLPNEFMTTIFEDSKGGLWFGGLGGLSKFENGKLVTYAKGEGLVGNYVRSIYEDADGALWVGTYDEGMSRFKDGRFTNYNEQNGLFSNGVFAIEEDEAGYFWISSNRGIYRVKRQELNDVADGKATRIYSVGYGKEDGMFSNECNGGRQPASIRDDQGRFWFPTQEGVSIIDPKLEQPNPLPPSVVIEEVLVEREPVDFRAGIVIDAGRKDVEIRYTGISLLRSSQTKFQYKLEGHDVGWVDAGTRRTAHYSYLPPGKYTFRVKAANSDGVWAEKAADLPIEFRPHFYQTTFFYLVCGLAAAIILLLFWKLSVHQLEARERKLTRLVDERTRALAEANANLETLANSDGLTKIGNRRRFESFLADEWHRAVRFKTEISLVMIDIDHFKRFNDTYGHQAGDECLQLVAEAFADTIKRPTDLVARFGGEEFAVVLGGTDSAGALNIAEQAIENVNALRIPHSESSTSDFLTVSVGIATMFATLETTEADLIKAADRALYQAKENGRDQIHVSDHSAGGPPGPIVIIQERMDAKPS